MESSRITLICIMAHETCHICIRVASTVEA